MRARGLLIALVPVAIAAGLGTWFALQRPSDPFAPCRGSSVAGGDIGGPFTLVSETGERVTEAEVLAEPSLVYFGYTFCPDVCPLDNARNAEAAMLLEERGLEVQPVFITVDPERDTPEVMADYTELFHSRMLGLSGSPEEIDAAAAAFRVYHKAQPAEDAYYLVDHSTQTFLMLPGVGFADFFRRDESAEAVAERTACFLERL